MHVLTLVADPARIAFSSPLVADIARCAGASEVVWLAEGEAADLLLPTQPADGRDLRAMMQLGDAPIDTILQPLAGRRKRLLIADMDSTIVTGETLDELAAQAGVGEEVAAITRASMNGELDFAAALRARVGLLRGLPLAALEATWRGVRLTEGAAELVATMRAHGAVTALVSGGFTFFTTRVAERVGFDLHRANVLLDDGAVLTGRLAEPILDRDAKRATLHELAAARGITLPETLAVGDGANDLDMVSAAGLGIAFKAKPILARAAAARIDHTSLRSLLFAQGFRAGDIVTA